MYETSVDNSYQLGGFSVNENAFLGSRFTLAESIEITSIGGGFSVDQDNEIGLLGPIFGAIVEMNGLLPQGTDDSPFNDTEVLAYTTFSPDSATDTIVPLSVTLGPGDYAIVFGSGLFGADGSNAMDDDGVTTPEAIDSFFYFSHGNWFNGATDNTRFLVFGEPVPEPTSLALLAAGGLFITRRRR